MGKDGPTDVLSFPLLPPSAYPEHPGQDPAVRIDAERDFREIVSFDMYPVTVALLGWGDRWFAPAGAPPLVLLHKACGQRLDPVIQCAACDAPAPPESLAVPGS